MLVIDKGDLYKSATRPMQRTNITRFPREFASLTALVEVDATGCPLKASHNAILQYHGMYCILPAGLCGVAFHQNAAISGPTVCLRTCVRPL